MNVFPSRGTFLPMFAVAVGGVCVVPLPGLSPQLPHESVFHCGVLYEDSLYSPFKGQLELHEDVKIYIEENYEQINVPVPQFGGSDPADIIHDFQRVRSSWALGAQCGAELGAQFCVHGLALSLLSHGLFLSCPPARGPLWVFPTLSACLVGRFV